MKVPIPAPEEPIYEPGLTLGHLFNGSRCIYCGWAYYQTGADDPCESTPEERVGSWTFDAERNDMVAWEREKYGPDTAQPVDLDGF